MRDARFVRETLMFQMWWCHRGPFPRRTREQRKFHKRLSAAATRFEVDRIGAQMEAGTYTEDRSWRPTA